MSGRDETTDTAGRQKETPKPDQRRQTHTRIHSATGLPVESMRVRNFLVPLKIAHHLSLFAVCWSIEIWVCLSLPQARCASQTLGAHTLSMPICLQMHPSAQLVKTPAIVVGLGFIHEV